MPETPSAVPDVLAPGLDVVFCGINPGFHSDAKAAHFANPRNDFWRLLHAAGFTPRLVDPSEQLEVLRYGIGITNAAYRTTRGLVGPPKGRLRRQRGAARAARGRAPAAGDSASSARRPIAAPSGDGRSTVCRTRRLGETLLFVLPSTSPANAAVPWDERLGWFRALRSLVA